MQEGTAFFRTEEGKCPNCGSFGQEQEDFHRCPTCSTMFNEYVILEDGMNLDMKNN